MKHTLTIIILALIYLINHCQSQDSATASINNMNPFVGETIMMSCTLVRAQRFSRESVNYVINNEFNVDSSTLNGNSGSVGGIDVFRMTASTAASNDNRVTLRGEIILRNVQISDAVDGNIKLGCVGIFGINPEDNVNVTGLAAVPREVIPDSATATINNAKPYVGETLEVNCVLFRQQGFTEDMARYIVNDAFSVAASAINGNSGTVGGIPIARLEASTDPSEDNGETLRGRIILSDVQIADAVDGNITLGCVGLFGSNSQDNINVSSIAAVPESGGSYITSSSIIIGSSILLSLFSPLVWL